jgi:hypothetical protein
MRGLRSAPGRRSTAASGSPRARALAGAAAEQQKPLPPSGAREEKRLLGDRPDFASAAFAAFAACAAATWLDAAPPLPPPLGHQVGKQHQDGQMGRASSCQEVLPLAPSSSSCEAPREAATVWLGNQCLASRRSMRAAMD